MRNKNKPPRRDYVGEWIRGWFMTLWIMIFDRDTYRILKTQPERARKVEAVYCPSCEDLRRKQ